MIHASSAVNITLVPILSAVAPTSGRVSNLALSEIIAEMTRCIGAHTASFDALIIVLSGCMVTETWESGDLAVLQAARSSAGADTPVMSVLSNLANLSQPLIDASDLSLGFDLTDRDQVRRAARQSLVLASMLGRGTKNLVSEWRKLPLLIPLTTQRPSNEALRSVRALAAEFEDQPEVLDASIFPGFPFSDTRDAGCSVLVTTENDPEHASSLANRLRTAIWTNREAFHEPYPNIETVVHEAMLVDEGSTLIADLGDDPGAGGSGEGTGMLWALIDLGARDVALALIVDPVAVEVAILAGVASEITIDLGGGVDRRAGYPVEVKARVRRISDGQVTVSNDGRFDLGRAVVLAVEGRHGGEVDVIVSERAVEPSEPDIFRALGVDLERKKIICVKSSWRYLAPFVPENTRMLATTTPGITTPVLAYFDFERIPRPIFPLDPL